MSRDTQTLLAQWQSKGGKFSISLYRDESGSYIYEGGGTIGRIVATNGLLAAGTLHDKVLQYWPVEAHLEWTNTLNQDGQRIREGSEL